MTYYTYKTDSGKNAFYYEANGFRVSFLENEANTDYQAYLKWVAEGNTPQPAE